jgi:hypothetical protein
MTEFKSENSVTVFVNVNGREPVLSPGPLSRRSDKSTGDQSIHFTFVSDIEIKVL